MIAPLPATVAAMEAGAFVPNVSRTLQETGSTLFAVTGSAYFGTETLSPHTLNKLDTTNADAPFALVQYKVQLESITQASRQVCKRGRISI